jgi:methylenetetrahydrofolate dehydrogenase (NADP+)/methenyltetrahydrofolate cyclohydrolase
MKIYKTKSLGKILREKIIQKRLQYENEIKLAIFLGEKGGDAEYYAESLIKKAVQFHIKAKIFNYTNSSQFLTLLDSDEIKLSDGILALAPYPNDLKSEYLQKIPAEKDVDCINTNNFGKLFAGSSLLAPATAESVLVIAKKYFEGKLEGKNIVIVGRSVRVGKPLVPLFLSENCTVTICHSRTLELSQITKTADIVVCAIGKADFFGPSYFRDDQFIIDVGINKLGNKIVGDVNTDLLKDIDCSITPVPGGVGTITSYIIYKNLLYLLGQGL